MGIADWPASERPRERLLRQGAAALSDAELLAIFLRTGRRGRSAVDLGRDVLEQVGGLHRLMAADRKQLCAIGGLGEAKFALVQAAFELTRRALATTLEASNSLTRPDAVHEYLQLVIGAQPHEVFMVVFLDTQHRVLAAEELFRGTLAQTSVYPREVVKRALAVNCAAVILAHNHPSGLAEPSAADRALTQALKSALGLIDVRVLDHLVVAGGRVFSFAANGLL